MTEEEIAACWDAYQSGEDWALEALVIHYEPLARYLARRALVKAPPHQEAADLISYAHHGLLDAIRKFEPARGLKFETYASRRIAGEIIDGQRKQDPLSRPIRRRVRALRDAQQLLWDRLGRQGTLDELAEELGENVFAVRQLMVQQQTLTRELDDLTAEALHTASFEADLEFEEYQSEVRNGLARLLPRLSDRHRAFVVMHYVDRRSLRDIGKAFGISDARCGQIRREVIQTLVG